MIKDYGQVLAEDMEPINAGNMTTIRVITMKPRGAEDELLSLGLEVYNGLRQ